MDGALWLLLSALDPRRSDQQPRLPRFLPGVQFSRFEMEMDLFFQYMTNAVSPGMQRPHPPGRFCRACVTLGILQVAQYPSSAFSSLGSDDAYQVSLIATPADARFDFARNLFTSKLYSMLGQVVRLQFSVDWPNRPWFCVVHGRSWWIVEDWKGQVQIRIQVTLTLRV